ncbi:MAG: B12-binding domain-containing protein [Candidatus Hydrothermarchaeales archaeon]
MILDAVVNGEIDDIGEMVRGALNNGTNADHILEDMIRGMDIVGEKFESKEYYVPEVLLSAHAMQRGLEILRPHLAVEKLKVHGKVVIGTVEGDVHDIGKNLVAMFLEGAGFEVHNLGRDIPTPVYVEKTIEVEPDIVGLSAMMSTTMEKMREIIEELGRRGIREKVLIIAGGASITQDFADEIGADGYAPNASKAVKLCEKLMREKNELP